jgi:CBS domain containing-hemolysin-like protein
LDSAELARSKAEMAASEVSLKTNLFLLLTIMLLFTFFNLMLVKVSAFVSTVFKGLIPVSTAVANFSKIQHMLQLYWERLSRKCGHA